MHGLLLTFIALSNPMECDSARDLISRINPTLEARAEIVETIMENTEKDCVLEDAQVD
tara:strand:+ start:6089 stop:6262 length:174 start_codon:yes stop_codon:yes gene_type:complete